MSERADTARCRKIAALDAMQARRPIVDPVLDVVLVDCPRCKAQDADSQRLYRPVRLVPRGRVLTAICSACGDTSVRRS